MKMTMRHVISALIMGVTLTSCTSTPQPTAPLGEGPFSFHDTRLRYALLIDDRRTLASDFAMTTEPTLPERIAAAFALPVSTVTEFTVWPAASAFRAFYERERR